MSDEESKSSEEKTIDEARELKKHTINAGGLSIEVQEISDEEAKERELNRFNEKFKDSHIVQITAKNERYLSRANMKLVMKFGTYDKGGWDTFHPESNMTIPKQIEKKNEEGDITPVRFFVGFNDEMFSEEDVEQFRSDLKRLTLTS